MEWNNKQKQKMLELRASHSLTEIGNIFGVSRERIRQLIKDSLGYKHNQRRTASIKQCEQCGKSFSILYFIKQRFCSDICRSENKIGKIAKRKSVEERFWSKVKVGGKKDCWEWQASTTFKGYGRINIWFENYWKWQYAHRISWLINHGKIPKDKHVLHHCDNPSCVNPKHLWLGTHQDNIKDRDKKGRTRNGYSKNKLSPILAFDPLS